MMYPSNLYRFGVLCVLVFYFCEEVFSDDVEYLGCFHDQAENRLLSEVQENSNELTPTKCVDICSEGGYPFAGTQYSSQCFCGYGRPPQIAKRPESECSYNCSGDAKMKCGGFWRLSVYKTGVSAAGALPTGFHQGCFKENEVAAQESRIFPDFRQDFDNMTPKLCFELCFKKGYTLSGIQHANECYCTNRKLDHSKKTDDGECKMPCAGDTSKNCGGQWRMSVYSTGLTDIPANGRLIGCYEDAPGPNGEYVRVLGDFKTDLRVTNSPQTCLNMCYQMGYNYAGVQYAYECYCGNKRPLQSKIRPDDNCNAVCPGDPTEYCGANWRIQVYRTPTTDPPVESKPEPTRPDPAKPRPKPQRTTTTEPSETDDCVQSKTVINKKRVCKNDVIFFDDFNKLDGKKWKHKIKIASKPDYEFTVYTDKPQNSFTKDGSLHIKPTIFDENFVETGEIHLDRCTGDEFNGECSQDTQFSILPPIQSARLITKQSFEFKYGIVEVEAKLPVGDWITSEIALLPVNSAYGAHYESGKVRFAFRGNQDLKYKSGKDLGHQTLEGSVMIGYGTTVKEKSLLFTESEGWQHKFHNYTIIWSPDDIIFMVDGKRRQSVMQNSNGLRLSDMLGLSSSQIKVWSTGTPIAPFDKPFYISLGVSAGGIRDFEEGSESHGRPKPWSNSDPKAMLTFWNQRKDWQHTWQKDKTSFIVKSVRVKAV